MTEKDIDQQTKAVGVQFRDTWTGEIGELKSKVVVMSQYPETLSILVIEDDEVNQKNGVTLDPILKYEHGFIPVIHFLLYF